jgi:hypothetical protein
MSARGHIIGPGGYIEAGEQKFVIAVIDLDAEEIQPTLIRNTFLGHDVAIDPSKPHQASVFEKKGPGACQVDLRDGKVLRPITTADNQHFYGHGAYSMDGAILYATESVLDDDYRGVLTVRDASTLELLGELPTYGTSPHDCWLIDDGKTMVVANGGGHINGGAMPNVTYVDIASEALIERVEMPKPRFNAGHLAISENGDLAVVSAPRDGLANPHQQLGAVTLIRKGQEPTTLERPSSITEAMFGEALSVVLYEPEDLVMVTHPDGNMVSMWKLSDNSSMGRIDFTEPRGVTMTLDAKYFVVSHKIDKSVAITLLDANSRAPELTLNPSFTSGSHLYIHDLAAAA